MKTLPEIIETERLILRPFTLSDCEHVFRYASDPDVTRFMDWPAHTSMETSREWIQLTLDQWQDKTEYTWGITSKQQGDYIVGAIGCSTIAFKVSFGYVLDKAYWGKGIATEAAKTLVDRLSNIEGVKRIWATCDCENTASVNVLSKSGCTREGILHNWLIRPNLPGAPATNNYVYAKTIDA